MRRPPRTIGVAAIGATMLCSTWPAASADGGGGALDARRYVDAVLRASLAARVADAEAAFERAEGAGAGRWANPAIAWQRESAGARPAATQDTFSFSWPLVLSGRLGLEREAARQGAEAALARRERARAELTYEASRRFHGVLAARERKAVLEASRATLRDLSATIVTRERAGDASGYDRLRIGLEAAAVEDLVRGAVIEERSARAAALALLGPEAAGLPDLVGSLAEAGARPPRMPAIGNLETRRADLRALELDSRAAGAAERAADRAWIPEPVIQGGAQILDAGQPNAKRGYVVGVEVPLPIFQRQQGEKARAAARRSLADARRAALMRETHTRLGALSRELSERRARLESHRKDVLLPAEELRRIAHSAYRGGASDLLVLVDAERAAREARLSAVELASAVIEASAALELLSGASDGGADSGGTE